jgi:Trk-type K+ transport system membrane component
MLCDAVLCFVMFCAGRTEVLLVALAVARILEKHVRLPRLGLRLEVF